jgi:integrase
MDWELNLRRRGLSPTTAYHYAMTIRRAERVLARRGSSIAGCSEDDALAIVAATPATNASRSMLRGAMRHAWAIEGRTDPPFWALRAPKRARMRSKALEEHRAATLEAQAWKAGYPMGTATLIGLYAGLRRFEVAKLRLEHLEHDGWLQVVGKGDVEARVPCHPRLAEHLRDLGAKGWVFPGRFGGSVAPATVWDWIRKVSESAGIPVIPPHVLRHTMITTIHRNTGDLLITQELARHLDPRVTSGYVRLEDHRLVDAIASLCYAEEPTR